MYPVRWFWRVTSTDKMNSWSNSADNIMEYTFVFSLLSSSGNGGELAGSKKPPHTYTICVKVVHTHSLRLFKHWCALYVSRNNGTLFTTIVNRSTHSNTLFTLYLDWVLNTETCVATVTTGRAKPLIPSMAPWYFTLLVDRIYYSEQSQVYSPTAAQRNIEAPLTAWRENVRALQLG